MVTSTIKTIKNNQEQDKADKDRRKLNKIRKPITPPKYYLNISDREKNVKDGPYSVKGIKDSLGRGILPIGYSVEQLKLVGFSDDVDLYLKNRENIVNNLNKQLKDGFIKLKEFVKTDFSELSEADRRAIEKTDILNPEKQKEILNKIDGWIIDIDNNELTSDVLDSMINIINTRMGIVTDSIGAFNSEQELNKNILKAENEKDNAVLTILRRSLLQR